MGDVERYIAGLGAALRGPRQAKADLLAEARDSLCDAADAYQEKGLTAADAARRAVAEFGGYAEIVPAYQAELTVAQGRRTALLMAAGLAGVQLATAVLWHPAHAGWLATGFTALCLAGAALALLVWLGFGWGSRYVPDGVALTRVLGRAGLAFLALHGLAGLGVYLPRTPGGVAWLALAGMALAFQYAALSAWRCVAVTRAAVTRAAVPALPR